MILTYKDYRDPILLGSYAVYSRKKKHGLSAKENDRPSIARLPLTSTSNVIDAEVPDCKLSNSLKF